MDKVKLMDRMDSKYMFNLARLPKLLTDCKAHYFVVNINGKRSSAYDTQYFDTEDYRLYNHHHSGKLNRYKIRQRTYIESDLSFLEVKFKDNKGRTTKDRVKLKAGSIDQKAKDFLEAETSLKLAELQPSVKIFYTRITLVHKSLTERITIDVNLTVSKGQSSREFHNLVIAEVKQNKAASSEFTHMMRELRVKQGGMSKYCIGVSNLVEAVKKNNFKEKNNKINKLNKI